MIDLRKTFNLQFEQEESGNWYIVLPKWTGSKASLQMVAGADDLLTEEAKGAKIVTVNISLDKRDGYKHLTKLWNTPIMGGGALYRIKHKPVWLCKVTEFVFDGQLPKDIYFKTL
jgi:hypothetical protein